MGWTVEYSNSARTTSTLGPLAGWYQTLAQRDRLPAGIGYRLPRNCASSDGSAQDTFERWPFPPVTLA
jgi:hypothetical protein